MLSISHLLAFMPRSAGSWSRSSSNSSFISFLRLRSASLWDMRSSGEREYGVEPGSFCLAGDGCEAFASSCTELLVDEPGEGSWPGGGWSLPVCTRDGGRERDLRALAGPDAGGMFSGGGGSAEGADIRRSCEKGAVGGIWRAGS